MWSPKKYCYYNKNFTKMKAVELKISKVSEEVCMSYCPKGSESSCGIQYRSY